MYFATYGEDGIEKAGVLSNEKNRIVELNQISGIGDYESMLDFIINSNDEKINIIKSALESPDFVDKIAVEIKEVELFAPIRRPIRNIICLGLNYKDHIKESQSVSEDNKLKKLKHPVYFSKMASIISGSEEKLLSHSEITEEIDYEVELAVIIGKEGLNIRKEKVEDYIFGYSIFNDMSARDLQRNHMQWIKGKSLDTFSVMGPYIAHKSCIPFPVHLDISSKINGELRQNSNTEQLIFDIPYIISDLSKGTTLRAGDIIVTGTPAGVGMGFKPPRYLKSGDRIEMEIEKIGVLKNMIT